MQFLRKYWLLIAAALILIVVAAAQCAPYMIEDMQRQQGRANVEALLAEGRYEEAQEEMSYWFMHGCNTDEDYARYFLCDAYVAYENGNVDNADMYLRLSAKYRPERLWNEQTRAFADTVAEEAEVLAAQRRAEAAAEAAERRAAYQERVRTEPTVTRSPSPRRDYEEEEEEDRFNASSYANEEDFYYDNYYDFFDYEDAADYYREHTE